MIQNPDGLVVYSLRGFSHVYSEHESASSALDKYPLLAQRDLELIFLGLGQTRPTDFQKKS